MSPSKRSKRQHSSEAVDSEAASSPHPKANPKPKLVKKRRVGHSPAKVPTDADSSDSVQIVDVKKGPNPIHQSTDNLSSKLHKTGKRLTFGSISPDDSPLSALESDAEVSAAPKLNSPVEIQQVANSKISGEIVDVKKGPNPTPRSIDLRSKLQKTGKRLSFGSILVSPDDSPLSALESDAEVSAAPKLNAPVQQVGKRIRQPSSKVIYMAEATSGEDDDIKHIKKRSVAASKPKPKVDIDATPIPKIGSDVELLTMSPPGGESQVNTKADSESDQDVTPKPKTRKHVKVQQEERKEPAGRRNFLKASADGDASDNEKMSQKHEKKSLKSIKPSKEKTKKEDRLASPEWPSDAMDVEEEVPGSQPVFQCEIRPFGSKKNGVFEEEIGLPGDPHFDVMFGFEAVLEVLDEKPARAFKRAIKFTSLGPFVNLANAEDIVTNTHNRDSRLCFGVDGSQPVVGLMTGIVTSCHIVQPTTNSAGIDVRRITIIPVLAQFEGTVNDLGIRYSRSHFYGPIKKKSLLTFASRRAGLSKGQYNGYANKEEASPRKNSKFFQKRSAVQEGTGHGAVWYTHPFPPYLDFDEEVPIYDAHGKGFEFKKKDFDELCQLPRYKQTKMLSSVRSSVLVDLPVDAIVTIAYTINTFTDKKDNRPEPSPSPGPSKKTQNMINTEPVPDLLLSLNLQFVILHGHLDQEEKE